MTEDHRPSDLVVDRLLATPAGRALAAGEIHRLINRYRYPLTDRLRELEDAYRTGSRADVQRAARGVVASLDSARRATQDALGGLGGSPSPPGPPVSPPTNLHSQAVETVYNPPDDRTATQENDGG